MPIVSLDLPEDVFSALRRSPDEFARELRLAAAIHWYERGEISQEKAACIGGLDRTDFLLALAREQVDAFVVEFNDLKRELHRGCTFGSQCITPDFFVQSRPAGKARTA